MTIDDWTGKIHCGKCEELIPRLPDNCVDLAVTSPPYNVDIPYDNYQDNKEYLGYISWLKDIFGELKSKLVKGGRVCINIGDKENGKIPTHSHIIDFMTHELKYLLKTTIIWNKSQIGNRCLLYDELMNTADGYKEIRQIQVKDKILTHNSRYKQVSNIFHNKYTGWLYTIYSYGNEPIRITQGHELLTAPLVRRYNNYPRKQVSPNLTWLAPEHLDTEYYLVVPIYHTQYHGSDRAFLDRLLKITGIDIDYKNEGFFRLLGYYIGDGSVHRNEVRIDFNSAEQFYINDVQNISNYYGWDTRFEYIGNCTRVVISSRNKLPRILTSLAGKYAHSKNMHPFLKQLPIYLQKHIVIGMMRSDGYIKDDVESSYTTVSSKIAYQFRDILLRLKIIPSIITKDNQTAYIKGRKVTCKKVYIVQIMGKYAKIMANICQIACTSKAKYRYNRYKKKGSRYAFFKIKNMKREWVTDLDVYNMEVEEDQSYTGKVVYHNCSWGSWKSPANPSFPTPFEYILVFCNESQEKIGKKEAITVSSEEFITNSLALWTFAPENHMKKFGHPAMFPPELPRRLIQQLSYKNDIVLDIFSGMGTTCLEAAILKRRWIGLEMSKYYVIRSEKRIKRYTNQVRLF